MAYNSSGCYDAPTYGYGIGYQLKSLVIIKPIAGGRTAIAWIKAFVR